VRVELVRHPVSKNDASNEILKFTLGPPQLLLGYFPQLYEEVSTSSNCWRSTESV
jgi:hypothetical protein